MSLGIRNISKNIDEETIRNHFDQFGHLEKVEILSNGKRNDAFLVFNDSRDTNDAYDYIINTAKKPKSLIVDLEKVNFNF